LRKSELNIGEIEDIFKSIGHIYFFNISGGEPFLRKDLSEIVVLACKYLQPDIIHTPTNGLSPELIESQTRRILGSMKECGYGKVPFTIKPSFDGVGDKHDDIRGVTGNFVKVLETYDRLKRVREEYPNLHLGLGTVISKFNYKNIPEIADYVQSLSPDSYINEIAEQRSELFTKEDPITPAAEEYEEAIQQFLIRSREIIKKSRRLDRVTQSFRLVYYDLVIRTLKEKRQIIPCYAGISNAHINPYGELWPCCILGYDKPMGDLRSAGCDFQKVWHSEQARAVREYIKAGKCHCPLANQAYSNILCNPKKMVAVLKSALM
jgi:MoaA/NifB/PqqE/SkfB family radical SAM enzyme